MKNYRPIFWGQGELLTPQHLQQQDLYHHTHANGLWRMAQAFSWGVKTLEIREEALENQSIELLNVELVTPEGLFLKAGSQCSEPNALLHPRKFEDYYDATKGPLDIYLAITSHEMGQENVAENEQPIPDEQLAKRYFIAHKKQNDVYDPDAHPVDVPHVNFYLRIYFGNEKIFQSAHKMLDMVKIAQLEPTGSETGVKISKHFIPPTLQLKGAPVLVDLIKNIRDLLAGRAQEFEGFIRERGVRASIGSPQDLLRTFMLQTIHRYIPVLQHWVECQSQHPEYMYQELRRMVGELSVFSEEYSVFGENKLQKTRGEGLLPYDHNNLWPCFHKAWITIRELVMAMTTGPEDSVTLEYDGVDTFSNNLKVEFFEQPFARYYLMIDSEIKGQELSSLLQNTGKISSVEEMEQIRKTAVFGLKINYLSSPPEELPQKSTRYTYFEIDTKAPQWQSIKESRNIAVFCDLDPEDTVIKVIRVGGQT